MSNAKPGLVLVTPDSRGNFGTDEFRIDVEELVDQDRIVLSAGKTKTTAINKAIRTLRKFIKELEKELS